MMASIVTAMYQMGTPPQIVYSYIRTGGMIVTESTKDVWLPEDVAERAAVNDQYSAQEREAK
jgi:hypothetical protein